MKFDDGTGKELLFQDGTDKFSTDIGAGVPANNMDLLKRCE